MAHFRHKSNNGPSDKMLLASQGNLQIMNCIITGASKGLGRAMAERFAAGGYDLALIAREGQRLSATQRELEARYPEGRFQSFSVDMGEREQVDSLGRGLAKAGVVVDVLINNAGQFIPWSVHGEPEGVLERLMTVNLYGAYHLTRLLLPAMMARRSGHIFNICSVASLQAYPNGGAYSISKYALAGFSANLREEMKPHGIKVTTVYPGAAFTDSWSGTGVDPARIMTAADVAEMVYTASRLSPQATVEEILLRPQLGDL
jgi:short-subunit dehydrogenase